MASTKDRPKTKGDVTAMTSARDNDNALAALAGFASAPDLGQSSNRLLEKAVERGEVRRMSIGSRNYYEIETSKKLLEANYNVPEGYVSAMDLERQLDVESARPLRSACLNGKIKGARKLIVDSKKPQWFCDERLGRAYLSKVAATKVQVAQPPAPQRPTSPTVAEGDVEDVLALVRGMISAQNQRATALHDRMLALIGEMSAAFHAAKARGPSNGHSVEVVFPDDPGVGEYPGH